jgi:hypothetical protein
MHSITGHLFGPSSYPAHWHELRRRVHFECAQACAKAAAGRMALPYAVCPTGDKMPAGRPRGDGRANVCDGSSAVCRERYAPLLQRREIHEHVRRRARLVYAAPEALPFQTRDRKADCWRIIAAAGDSSCWYGCLIHCAMAR